MISVKVVGVEELTFRLDQIPRKLREILKTKFENIFMELTTQFFEGVPGKFLDPKQIETGVSEQGSLLIGYLQYTDKDGVYSILPKKSPFLYNIDTKFFAYEVHAHPFPKGVPMIERLLRESKPWIEEQLHDALYEAL